MVGDVGGLHLGRDVGPQCEVRVLLERDAQLLAVRPVVRAPPELDVAAAVVADAVAGTDVAEILPPFVHALEVGLAAVLLDRLERSHRCRRSRASRSGMARCRCPAPPALRATAASSRGRSPPGSRSRRRSRRHPGHPSHPCAAPPIVHRRAPPSCRCWRPRRPSSRGPSGRRAPPDPSARGRHRRRGRVEAGSRQPLLQLADRGPGHATRPDKQGGQRFLHTCELRTDRRAKVLGVEIGTGCSRPDKIREQDGDDLAFVTGSRRYRSSTGRAETRGERRIRATSATDGHSSKGRGVESATFANPSGVSRRLRWIRLVRLPQRRWSHRGRWPSCRSSSPAA